MGIIQKINRLRTQAVRPDVSEECSILTSDRAILEERLQGLHQRLTPEEENIEAPIRKSQILATAELYRLTTLLYLQRVSPLDGDKDTRATYIEQAFHVLAGLEVATSPWPVFVLACESQTDEHRILMLQTLDRMDNVRGIGNVHVLRGIVETFWKQHDLSMNIGSSRQVKWWEMANCDKAVPWFI